MSKHAALLLVCALALATAWGTANAASYTGKIWYQNGIEAADGWAYSTTSLEWLVTYTADNLWEYTYTFTVPSDGQLKQLSHIIIECSRDLAVGEITLTGSTASWSPIAIQEWSSGGSNPDMPAPLYGIKFNRPGEVSGPVYTISFKTARVPVWGDFYAKDGQGGGVWATAWNSGFSAVDPNVQIHDGPEDGHILVPDTKVTIPIIPEWNTGILALSGLLTAGVLRRKFQK